MRSRGCLQFANDSRNHHKSSRVIILWHEATKFDYKIRHFFSCTFLHGSYSALRETRNWTTYLSRNLWRKSVRSRMLGTKPYDNMPRTRRYLSPVYGSVPYDCLFSTVWIVCQDAVIPYMDLRRKNVAGLSSLIGRLVFASVQKHTSTGLRQSRPCS